MAGHFTNDLLGTTGAEVFAPREGAILNSLFLHVTGQSVTFGCLPERWEYVGKTHNF